jgi:hypothetical protein
VLWFYAREQGAAFASRAASGTLLGVLSLCVFLLIYAWAARRLGWLPCVLLGWSGFTLATFLLAHAPLAAEAGLGLRLLAVFAALAITLRALPRLAPGPPARRPRHDLFMRMLATAVLVVSLTGVAHLLGPSLSGLFTPFPVATSVLVVFAHRQGGAGGGGGGLRRLHPQPLQLRLLSARHSPSAFSAGASPRPSRLRWR